jgi:signal transduction histidine kinase
VRVTQDRLTALADAAEALSGELSLDVVLDTIVRAASKVTHARYAALAVIGDDQTISRFVTHGADEDTIRAIGHYPTGKGLLGLLIRDPRVIRLEDLSTHPASYGFPEDHPPMTTFLGAPVRSGGHVYGNLYLTEKPGGFTEDDEQLILVLASQAGTAIENALLSERLQSLAVQDERERISRELHYGVIQSLFSIGMGLESARALLPSHPERVDDRLNSAVDGIDGAIRELRNYIFRLRPHDAAAMGLTRGLAELAREYEVNALVRPTLEVEPGLDPRIPDPIVTDLLQIAREALSNVAKHAAATRVIVRAGVHEGWLHLDVADDGTGFNMDVPQIGRGLDNMIERAATLGGTLDVDTSPGAGTVVRLRALVDNRSNA